MAVVLSVSTKKVRVIWTFDADGPKKMFVLSKVCVTVVCLNRIFLTRLNAWPTIWLTNVQTNELFVLSEFVLTSFDCVMIGCSYASMKLVVTPFYNPVDHVRACVRACVCVCCPLMALWSLLCKELASKQHLSWKLGLMRDQYNDPPPPPPPSQSWVSTKVLLSAILFWLNFYLNWFKRIEEGRARHTGVTVRDGWLGLAAAGGGWLLQRVAVLVPPPREARHCAGSQPERIEEMHKHAGDDMWEEVNVGRER